MMDWILPVGRRGEKVLWGRGMWDRESCTNPFTGHTIKCAVDFSSTHRPVSFDGEAAGERAQKIRKRCHLHIKYLNNKQKPFAHLLGVRGRRP